MSAPASAYGPPVPAAASAPDSASPARHGARFGGFTLVELLVAVALGSLVALILASLLHGLVRSDRIQTRHLEGPIAARNALLRLARETACAFAPPDPKITPLSLELPTDWGEPELRLSFYLPVPSREPRLPGFYGVERVVYEVRTLEGTGTNAVRELVRLSSPCAGPQADDRRKTTLLRGPFQLAVRVPDAEGGKRDASMSETWPSGEKGGGGSGEDNEQPPLPPSLWFSIRLPGQEPIETETLVHCAHVLEAPKGRRDR